MRRLWIGIAGLGLAIGGVFWACSAEQATRPSSHGIATPLCASTSRPGSVSEEPQQLDFRSFTAFLDGPRFETARVAYDDANHDQALELYEAALGASLARGELSPEAWFQLGHLRARAGRHAAAALAFGEAAEQRWTLIEYGRYFAALAHHNSGDTLGAAARLGEVSTGLPFWADAMLLEAELVADDDPARAERNLRRLVSEQPRPERWARASLELSRVLLRPGTGQVATERLVEALELARGVSLRLAGSNLANEATELEREALARMSPEAFQHHQPLSEAQELVRLSSLVDQRRWDDALVAAKELLVKSGKSQPYSELDCEARLLQAKALGGQKAWGKAVDQLGGALEHCSGDDLGARLRFTAGKFAQIDKRYSSAIRILSDLEAKTPTHRLADDARIRRARCYLELGDEARFTDLLGSITDDYPDGDVALDGLFDLTIRRIEKGDWSQAANLLERALPKARREDLARDHELAGRERYFHARALLETGQKEQGLVEYESLIAERPLSYYMLHALSRLHAEDSARASEAVSRAIAATEQAPFSFPHRAEFDSESFQRAVALARHGELDWAERELGAFEALDQPDLLWAIALVYGRAGSATRAHQLARGRLTDWLGRWPVGDWRAAWELAFPRPFRPIVERVAKQEDVPETLIYAVMREESAFRPEVVSHADAHGLMQLIKPTAKHFGTKLGLPYDEAALRRPSINIALGASVLGNYGGYFPDDPLLAIPGYNAGPGRPRRWKKERSGLDFDVWVELIPFNETKRYTKRVLSSRAAYLFLYGQAGVSDLLLPRGFARE